MSRPPPTPLYSSENRRQTLSEKGSDVSHLTWVSATFEASSQVFYSIIYSEYSFGASTVPAKNRPPTAPLLR